MTTAPEWWPALMPGADDDPRGIRGQAAQLTDSASQDLVPLDQVFGAAVLPYEAREHARKATGAINEVRQHLHSGLAELDALAQNDLLPARGRERLTSEVKAKTATALRDLDTRSDAAIVALEAALTEAAQPTFPAGADRTETRESLVRLLDAADDPAAVVRELVAGADAPLAALAASPYAATYLKSRGVPADVIQSTAAYAAQAALTSGDVARMAAAVGLTKMNDLRKAKMKMYAAASFAVEWN